ncbi:MAG: type IV secretion system DNA-binding domain-containing protein [Gaiellaceae bacterium]
MLPYSNGLLLGETTDEHGDRARLYLENPERAAHLYVIGSTGAGKSKALASWACADLQAGYAFGVLDPHGDLIADILQNATAWPLLRLIEFGSEEMVTINPLEPIPGIDIFTQTVELVDVFRKVWELSEESSPRLLEILRNSLWTLIEAGETLLELEPLLTNKGFRERLIKHVTDEPVARFWRDRFERWPERERTLYVESTLNKASSFTADPRLRLMLGAKTSTINFREVMDKGQILLVDLSKGVLRTNTNLIGALLLSRIQMAAISRLSLPPDKRSPWHLYVDEFQNFATDSFAEMLSEARKMGLRLILAHQTLGQLPEKLRSTVLGNARSFVVFRCDRLDAELLARYVTDVEPGMVRYMDTEHAPSYEPLSDQWERAASELAALPLREAVLRTKGLRARRFRTLDFPTDSEVSISQREHLRNFGRGRGWLRYCRDLDQELAIRSAGLTQASSTGSEPIEPSSYWESTRGSD